MPVSLNLRKRLVEVAMGRVSADLVIRNGEWVCVQTGEFITGTDVAIVDGHFAYVGEDAAHCIGAETKVVDAGGNYLVPGLLDGHMHVESGMCTVTEYVRAVAKRGTTGLFADPHEIANIFGLDGVKLMVEEAASQPIHVWVQMPSCVPAAPGLETPGASIGPDEVAEDVVSLLILNAGHMDDRGRKRVSTHEARLFRRKFPLGRIAPSQGETTADTRSVRTPQLPFILVKTRVGA